MKTNLTLVSIQRCIDGTAKKFKTVSAKILLNKGDFRNVALQVEIEEKGSKLASEGSEKLTKNVCDHVLAEFVKQVTKEKGWLQMHDGKVFGTEVKEGKEANVINANENLCYCNREKPVKKEIEEIPEKKEDLKEVKIPEKKNGKPKTLNGELRKENKSDNRRAKKLITEINEKTRGSVSSFKGVTKGEGFTSNEKIKEEAEAAAAKM